MIISKSPMRISLFGGSTDYKSFYEKYGSFIIGSTIDKYSFNAIRFRPPVIGDESVISYSKQEIVKNVGEIKNPLIREVLKYYGVNKPVDIHFLSDVPSRTGLGGSSSCCAALARSLCVLMDIPFDASSLCADSIKIEREILNEPGGIQDQIWACYGGFNSITIDKNGEYQINPIAASSSFLKKFKNSLMLIYSKKQRTVSNGSSPDEEKNKLKILEIAKNAYTAFENEDIKTIGSLLYNSWLEKRNTSSNISDSSIDFLIDNIMNVGAYGAKLLGNGGGGFVLVICDEHTKNKLKVLYKNTILDFELSTEGASTITI